MIMKFLFILYRHRREIVKVYVHVNIHYIGLGLNIRMYVLIRALALHWKGEHSALWMRKGKRFSIKKTIIYELAIYQHYCRHILASNSNRKAILRWKGRKSNPIKFVFQTGMTSPATLKDLHKAPLRLARDSWICSPS